MGGALSFITPSSRPTGSRSYGFDSTCSRTWSNCPTETRHHARALTDEMAFRDLVAGRTVTLNPITAASM
jgi:hypothetical protein